MSLYRRSLGIFLTAILVLLPFQYLWIRPFELQSNSELTVFLLTNWYEFLVALAVPALVVFFAKRQRLYWFDWTLLAVLALAVFSSLWSPAAGWTDLIGLRYGIGFIVFYFIARAVPDWTVNTEILKWVFYVVITISLLQGAVWLLGPGSQFWFLKQRDLAGDLPRLYGSLIGPNQLGTYTACLALWLYGKKKISGWWLSLAIVVVVGTFSRSALLGMIAGLIVIGYQQRAVIKWKIVGAVLVLLGMLFVLVLTRNSDVLQNTFIGSRHTEERVSAFERTIDQFASAGVATKLFGHGVTTAGPSTFVTDRVFVPENWFFQVLHEIGVLGLLALLIATTGAVLFLARNGSVELNSVFVAVAVNSLFLHPLADNPTVAILIFFLLAAAINTQERKRMLN